MFVLGITGGIGSGKTAVTDIFSEFNIDVIDADIASRKAVAVSYTHLTLPTILLV